MAWHLLVGSVARAACRWQANSKVFDQVLFELFQRLGLPYCSCLVRLDQN